MRRCTTSTLDKLTLERRQANHPAWLRAAISDSLNGHAISLDREDRMCKALGIASPKRPPRRFYRPCISVAWGETIKQSGWNIETIIAAGLKTLGETRL